jgi:hypothetical protein
MTNIIDMNDVFGYAPKRSDKYTVNNQREFSQIGGFTMFSVSIFSLRQGLRPFFIFLSSYILGGCDPTYSNDLRGVFGTNLS